MYVGLKQPRGDGERYVTPARAAAKEAIHFADRTSALHCGVNALHYGLIWGQSRSNMADDVEPEFENWKVSGLTGFLLARDVPVCDQAKAALVQNCYLAISLGLQPKKSFDEYAAQDVGQTKQGT